MHRSAGCGVEMEIGKLDSETRAVQYIKLLVFYAVARPLRCEVHGGVENRDEPAVTCKRSYLVVH